MFFRGLTPTPPSWWGRRSCSSYTPYLNLALLTFLVLKRLTFLVLKRLTFLVVKRLTFLVLKSLTFLVVKRLTFLVVKRLTKDGRLRLPPTHIPYDQATSPS